MLFKALKNCNKKKLVSDVFLKLKSVGLEHVYIEKKKENQYSGMKKTLSPFKASNILTLIFLVDSFSLSGKKNV